MLTSSDQLLAQITGQPNGVALSPENVAAAARLFVDDQADIVLGVNGLLWIKSSNDRPLRVNAKRRRSLQATPLG